MKQVFLRKGRISVEDVPVPANNPNHLLVEVSKSLISTGTELSSLNLSKASLWEKARKKPEAVAKVLQSIKVRGIKRTWSLVQAELDQYKPLGYSCVGRVLAVGENVIEFQVGDRVACAGASHANHAEIISVPFNLAVSVPVELSDSEASFVTVGAIALQGVRRADAKIGEVVGVFGLGLIGQITVQLLLASGCQVVGLDLDPARVENARKKGMFLGDTSLETLKKNVQQFTEGKGLDACLLTASTESSELVQAAFESTRKKGRIVVVGAVGMDLKRSPFYENEQDFLISCSYGPGRYDSTYEDNGIDYPYAYVRWTENRNMKSFLSLIAQKKISVQDLVGLDVPLQEADQAYQSLNSNGDKPLAALLSYPTENKLLKSSVSTSHGTGIPMDGKIKLGLVGVGNFVKTVHLPNLMDLEDRVNIVSVCTAHGASSINWSNRAGAVEATTNYADILANKKINAVLIATRHNLHGSMALEAIEAGKHIYLEKPLSLTENELEKLDEIIGQVNTHPVFMVGFNRRFAPYSRLAYDTLRLRKSPLVMTYRVNAGKLPENHWVLSNEGGGRLRGEACHMIDLFRFFARARLREAHVVPLHGQGQSGLRPDENFSAHFSYEDGSIGNLIYTSVGHDSVPKEELEIHWEGKTIFINDFREFEFYSSKPLFQSGRQDKGQKMAIETFLNSIKSGIPFPIPWDELKETTLVTIELDKAVWGRLPV